jgi:hypothetical protein
MNPLKVLVGVANVHWPHKSHQIMFFLSPKQSQSLRRIDTDTITKSETKRRMQFHMMAAVVLICVSCNIALANPINNTLIWRQRDSE